MSLTKKGEKGEFAGLMHVLSLAALLHTDVE